MKYHHLYLNCCLCQVNKWTTKTLVPSDILSLPTNRNFLPFFPNIPIFNMLAKPSPRTKKTLFLSTLALKPSILIIPLILILYLIAELQDSSSTNNSSSLTKSRLGNFLNPSLSITLMEPLMKVEQSRKQSILDRK